MVRCAPATVKAGRRTSMSLSEALSRGVAIADFLESELPAAFDAALDAYARWSEVDLKLCARFEGDGGGTWTLIATDMGLEVERGSTERPVVTVVGDAAAWPAAAPVLARLAAQFEARLHGKLVIAPEQRLTWKRLGALEKLQGVVQVSLAGTRSVSPEAVDPLVVRCVFGSADAKQPPRLSFGLTLEQLEGALLGRHRLLDLLTHKQLEVAGEDAFLLKLLAAIA